jgi:acyl-CoA hydrolase
LQDARQRADLEDRVGRRIVVGSIFCVASRMKVSERITSSSALIDFSRPTKSGTIMCGKTTMSRSGNTG